MRCKGAGWEDEQMDTVPKYDRLSLPERNGCMMGEGRALVGCMIIFILKIYVTTVECECAGQNSFPSFHSCKQLAHFDRRGITYTNGCLFSFYGNGAADWLGRRWCWETVDGYRDKLDLEKENLGKSGRKKLTSNKPYIIMRYYLSFFKRNII